MNAGDEHLHRRPISANELGSSSTGYHLSGSGAPLRGNQKAGGGAKCTGAQVGRDGDAEEAGPRAGQGLPGVGWSVGAL